MTVLSRDWTFVKQAADAEEAARLPGESVEVPHTWNATDGQDGGNDYHRGTCWYVRQLDKPTDLGDRRVWLEFRGAAMSAAVFLNKELLCEHAGGYSTFRVDLTDHLLAHNTIAVSVDNTENDRVYPQTADFTFYGGLYRPVLMLVVPACHFALGPDGGPGIHITTNVDPHLRHATVEAQAWIEGDASEVIFTINETRRAAAVVDGHASATFEMDHIRLWDGLRDPFLYDATASLASGDEVACRFGLRSFEIDPSRGFLLNGRPYPLRGVSRHQDRWGVGTAISDRMMREDMDIIRELGATTVRLAHYQHAQEFYDLCDECGIVVWAEIPYITMQLSDGRANMLSQMRELVVQSYNHPSIAVWGLSNEITAATPVDDALLKNHRDLNDLCHALDPSRLTTMANVFMLETDSELLSIPDVNSYNLYFGWYLGELEQNDSFLDDFHEAHPDMPLGLSEYGADANPDIQSAHPEKGDYSESYQCIYHEHMLEMIQSRPWLWATHVWNLFDFGADGRDEGGKHGQNQKGLVTFDRSLKKDAFYLYRAAWNKKDPFVHLCGSRYVDRAEDVTEVKVYSNCSEVSLFVDGALLGTQRGATVFRFQVPITGEHLIESKSGACCDAIQVRKVDAPNPRYSLSCERAVSNWFDREQVDPDFYSVVDTFGDLRKNDKAKAVIDRTMKEAAASRGDVATRVQDNPALQRMMERMTFLSLLKQGGADEQSVQQLNRVLQSIPK